MNIVMFSMTPLFPAHAMGGAQMQLRKVATFLGEQGHEVIILCTQRDSDHHAFEWDERVRIVPIFRFKQPYPEPYATAPHHIAAAIQDIGEYLRKADRYYSHDGGLIFPYVYQDLPTVISYRSVLFSETLQSGFLFQGDALILISEHAKAVYTQTAGRFFPGYEERVRVIYNGVDWERFAPSNDAELAGRLGVDPQRHSVLLYPHRPEEAKGIKQAVEVADRLVHQYHLSNLRVLVPRWLESALSPGDRAFYEDLTALIAGRGLQEHFVFHAWLRETDMPAYYTMGAATLCLGSYVETFGNVPYESLGCGTPAILAKVGPAREILPDHLVYKVDYGDVDAAAAIAARIIHGRERTSAAALSYLREHYSVRQMVEQYAQTILSAQRKPPLPYRHAAIDEATRFILAGWCYLAPKGIYHDFLATTLHDQGLIALHTAFPDGFSFHMAAGAGVEREEVLRWYREGFIVPRS